MKNSRKMLAGIAIALLPFAAFGQDGDGTAVYEVKAGDTLTISVWEDPALQRDVLVAPDGTFSFPLIGHVQVRGMGVADIETLVATELGPYIADPTVTVAIAQIAGNAIYVIGEVTQAGEFIMGRQLDVMQALSLAGGFTAFAKRDDIVILRRSAGRQAAIPFRYSQVANGRGLEQNIILQSGDTIVVP